VRLLSACVWLLFSKSSAGRLEGRRRYVGGFERGVVSSRGNMIWIPGRSVARYDLYEGGGELGIQSATLSCSEF